jgi:3-dehydroquinate synthase
MKKIVVKTKNSNYPVIIGSNSFLRLQKEIKNRDLYRNVFVIIDENVRKLYSGKILRVLNSYFPKVESYVLKPGESSKSSSELNKIYSALIKNKFGRDTLILAIGGGVTGDLAGYVASTFMRGVQLIQVPTTLLADIDSSIGGKTGINFDKKKNMIGTFYQPELVLIDQDFLKTLPHIEMVSGLGEVVKYAFITSQELYNFAFYDLNRVLLRNKSVLDKIIYESVLFKAAIVSQDERESGLRKILNFGHTFAHAYESELNFRIKHGEAVIAGIISVLFLSNLKGYLTGNLLKKFLSDMEAIKLSSRLKKMDNKRILDLMRSDKKNRNDKIKFVLIKNIGEIVTEVEANKFEVLESISLMKEALNN